MCHELNMNCENARIRKEKIVWSLQYIAALATRHQGRFRISTSAYTKEIAYD
jgi:hypothetical protein